MSIVSVARKLHDEIDAVVALLEDDNQKCFSCALPVDCDYKSVCVSCKQTFPVCRSCDRQVAWGFRLCTSCRTCWKCGFKTTVTPVYMTQHLGMCVGLYDCKVCNRMGYACADCALPIKGNDNRLIARLDSCPFCRCHPSATKTNGTTA
jgi:hypothetical protein